MAIPLEAAVQRSVSGSTHRPTSNHRRTDGPSGSATARPEWLIDNAAAYARLLASIRAARRSVWITQLAFDADCVAYDHDATSRRHQPNAAPNDTVLAECLLGVVERAAVDVRILLNATVLLDTARALRRFVARAVAARAPIAGRVAVRGIRRFPNFLHVKMVLVDGAEAFLLGSPFVNSYWDTPRHHPVDARRPMRELGGRPLHDVSLRLTGSAVSHLEACFAELWNASGATQDGDALPMPALTRHRPSGGEPCRVLRTLPRRSLTHAPHGSTDVLDALLDGIRRARSLIYVEHQYLTSRVVVAALADALTRRRDLELVVVLNQNPDLTAYWAWQNTRIVHAGLLGHPRAGLFTLWSAAPDEARPGVTVINQVFVHSKVIAIDDEWAMVGAANLDGLSLHSYGDEFSGRFARRVFRHVRNFEVSVVVCDDARSRFSTGSVAELRTRLWAEHLGVRPNSVGVRRPRGWLHMWRTRAAANVAALNDSVDDAGASPGMRGFVLPYSLELTPSRQLANLGVRVDRARLDVRFDPGPLASRLSAGWVRNMFA